MGQFSYLFLCLLSVKILKSLINILINNMDNVNIHIIHKNLKGIPILIIGFE